MTIFFRICLFIMAAVLIMLGSALGYHFANEIISLSNFKYWILISIVAATAVFFVRIPKSEELDLSDN
jgi:hypothetical protein